MSFNRLPALANAVSKRLGICMCAAYFDDLITLESLNFRASARPFLLLVLTVLGAPPAPAKSFPLGQHRAWLGAALNLATLRDDLYFSLQPKESSVTQVVQGCRAAIARGSLTPAEAATLRGQAGLTATLSAGRFGGLECTFSKPGSVNHILKVPRCMKTTPSFGISGFPGICCTASRCFVRQVQPSPFSYLLRCIEH